VKHRDLARELIRVGRALLERGLTRGTSGNLSARTPTGMLITPSAVPWDELQPDGLIELSLQPDEAGHPVVIGEHSPGKLRPSSEWRLHASVLWARVDIGAVVHAHPPFATALSCLRRRIPAFHYMVAAAGGHDIPCAPYATFGTAELADGVAETLRERRACLMANHGMIALGGTPPDALALATEVEALAEQYCTALQVGEPVLLPEDEMARVTRAFEDYRRVQSPLLSPVARSTADAEIPRSP
jgi:L-fuculose-phosphate aldolase